MEPYIEWAGDNSPDRDRAEACIRDAFERDLGSLHVHASYTAGQGYKVSAQYTPPAAQAYTPGETFRRPKPEDWSNRVREVMAACGLKLARLGPAGT